MLVKRQDLLDHFTQQGLVVDEQHAQAAIRLRRLTDHRSLRLGCRTEREYQPDRGPFVHFAFNLDTASVPLRCPVNHG